MINYKSILFASAVLAAFSCQKAGPKDINVGKDQCDNCKMTITDVKYAAELLTDKGRVYKFDDIKCLYSYTMSNPDKTNKAKTYVVDFPSGKFIEFEKATFIKGGSISSPMGGNMQAYKYKAAAQKAAKEFGAK